MHQLILLVLASVSGTWAGVAAQADRPNEVRWHGALREMMHHGRTATVVQTRDVAPGPHTYAVGALSELRGEVTIVDDQVWYSYPDGDGFRTVAGASNVEGAALLVVARVAHWEDVVLERDLTLPDLEDTLGQLAASRNLPPDSPFGFRIEALFPRLDLHVVDGAKLKPGASVQEHHAAAVRIEAENVPANLIGFHSTSHQGIFTHRGQTTHIHAVLANPLVTGHVDAAVIPRGAILKLPRQ